MIELLLFLTLLLMHKGTIYLNSSHGGSPSMVVYGYGQKEHI
jgi:hypothetical protein